MFNSKKLKLIFLYTGSLGFPLGDAYTNRILSIAKGLVAVGCDISILIIYPGRRSGVTSKSGVFESVPYKYLTPFTTSKNFFIKKIIGIAGIVKACLSILFIKNKVDAIISFAESSVQNNAIGYFAHLKNIVFIREINEYPRKILEKGKNGVTVSEERKIKNSLKSLDGIMCISNSLYDYFRNNYSFRRPILVLPIVVENERFIIPPSDSTGKFITYCGNLFGEKDGVDILISAFAIISQKHSDHKLKLIGDTGDNIEFEKMKQLIESLKLSDKVVFTGYIRREDIPYHLVNSKILVLARPDNIQAQGGFPTKLGEYLATAKPVVVTAVGDISRYLFDGVNAFIALPGSVESFAEKLDLVLDNYKIAMEAGREGCKLANTEFNAIYQANRIVEFIKELKKQAS